MSTLRIKYLLFLALLAGLLACGREEKAIMRLEQQLAILEDNEKKSETANVLHKAYSLYHLNNPGDTSFLLNWAKMAESGGEFEQACEIYSNYIELDSGRWDVFESRARVNARLGYFREAGLDFAKAARLNREYEKERSVHVNLSEYYMETDSVIMEAGNSIATGENILLNRLTRARRLMECRHYTAAEADISVVLGEEPNHKEALLLVAELGMKSGAYESAQQAFHTYFENVSEKGAEYSRAVNLKSELDDRMALRELDTKLASEPYAYMRLIDAGSIAFKLKDYNKTMVYVNRLIEVYPDSIYGYLYRGQVGIQTGELTNALKDFEKVVFLDPDNYSARNLRAYIYLLRNEPELLRSEIEEIIAGGGELLEVLQPYAMDQ